MNAPSAGWYQDPQSPNLLRYWSGTAWTEHTSPSGPRPSAPTAYRPASPPPSRSGHSGAWYFVITVLSMGLLSGVPYFHAASKLDRPQLRRRGAIFTGAALVSFALIGTAPEDSTGSPEGFLSDLGGIGILAVMLVASLMLIGPRRDIYRNGSATSAVPRPLTGNSGAVAGVEQARRKRAEARALAAEDPMMARELGIGRPGSPHPFDDGGLLDLNAATADDLIRLCGVPSAEALEVVAARTSLGRFLHVEDAIVYGKVGEDAAALVRDRGIIISDRSPGA